LLLKAMKSSGGSGFWVQVTLIAGLALDGGQRRERIISAEGLENQNFTVK